MKKNLQIFRISLANFTAYRAQVLLQFFESLLTPAFMLLALSSARSQVITLAELLPYYLIVTAFSPALKSRMHEQLGELTESGDINNYLLKPVSVFWHLFFTEASQKLVGLLFLSPVILISLSFQTVKAEKIVVIPFMLVVGFFISYCLSFLVGLLSFWIDEMWPIRNLFDVTTAFLGGLVLPYILLPRPLVDFLLTTPLSYSPAWISNYLRYPQLAPQIFTGLLWCVALYIFCRYLEFICIKKYGFTS